MIPRLLWPDQDFDPTAALPGRWEELSQDLSLATLFGAMAGDDEYLRSVVPKVVLQSVTDPAVVRYRQEVLTDCVQHPEVAEELYRLAGRAHLAEREAWGFGETPDSVLYRSVRLLKLLLPLMRQLRALADSHRPTFRSAGFRRLFDSIVAELDAPFFAEVEGHVARLESPKSLLVSVRLGPGNKAVEPVLRTARPARRSWTERIFPHRSPYSFELPERDESGLRALRDFENRGIASAARAVERSVGHVQRFFSLLRSEVGFYLAGLRLRVALTAAGLAVCLPTPLPTAQGALSADGLYEVCLALASHRPVVPNDLQADGVRLVLITGANEGGKSTFLRALGLSLLMLQAGLFVPARRMTASVGLGLYTHFKREEDTAMEGGKLDEELKRMSQIADRIRPGDFLLCNESFASTNEREGSEIAEETVRAFVDAGVRVVFVTHLYDLAERLVARAAPSTLFLRAERTEDGRRTFRILEGAPLVTSFGEDLYHRVFEERTSPPAASPTTS